MADKDPVQTNKKHKNPRAGKKFEKKELQRKRRLGMSDDQIHAKQPAEQNVKAFGLSSDAANKLRRSLDIQANKTHAKLVRRDYAGQPPKLVAIVGPPKVGKTTLMKSLIKHFTKQKIDDIQGPITLRSGKTRTTFFECPNDLNAMIDLAKVVDLVLLCIDASYGFEMETFEFLNILQVHGMTRVMGVLTHLDKFKENKQVRRLKKTLKQRFWTEVAQGAKVFYLSGLRGGLYTQRETVNLARFVSLVKPRPLTWRTQHPSVLVDRYEDITDPEKTRENPNCDRHVCLYGYVRGTFLRDSMMVHVPGCGDFNMHNVTSLPDPLPPVEKKKERNTLNEKSNGAYGPMSDLGELFYDKDAVYLTVDEQKERQQEKLTQLLQSKKRAKDASGDEDSEYARQQHKKLVHSLQSSARELDSNLRGSDLTLLSSGKKSIQLKSSAASEMADDDDDLSDDDEEDDGDGEDLELGSDEELEIEDGEDDDDLSDADDDEEMDDVVEQEDDGRERRKAAFSGGAAAAAGTSGKSSKKSAGKKSKASSKDEDSDNEDVEFDDSEDDEDDEADDQYFMPKPVKAGADAGEFEDDDSDEDDFAEESGEQSTKWKEKLDEKQSDKNFYSRKISLQDLVYHPERCADALDQVQSASSRKNTMKSVSSSSTAVSAATLQQQKKKTAKDQIMDLFGLSDEKQKQKEVAAPKQAPAAAATPNVDIDDLDFTREIIEPEDLEHDWDDLEVRESIRNKFVTGDWSKRRNKRLNLPTDGDANDLVNDYSDDDYGDQDEDGDEKMEDADGEDDGDNEDGDAMDDDEEESELAAIKRKREQKKLAFDQEYDQVKGVEGPTSIREIAEMTAKKDPQVELNKNEFSTLDQQQRERYEGFSPGAYVRIEIINMPPEFAQNVDFHNPILVGGLRAEESRMGFIRMRLKKHRWFPKVLKNKDPLVFSIGWRRFQSIPLYTVEDPGTGRNRMIKYTPEHMHCVASIWGPFVPQNTGVVAFQTLSSKVEGFRVSATGYTMELDHDYQIVKKLKLTGYPKLVKKNTAVITGMFNSDLEVAKFEGAHLKTVSGLRGQVKKVVKRTIKGVEPGDFRAAFEDKILMSDIIMLRTWYPIELDKFKFYNPVANHLTKHWLGMRTVGQLRKLHELPVPQKQDSVYKPAAEIKRSTAGHALEFRPKPQLLKKLPFKHQEKKIVEVQGVTDDLTAYMDPDAPVLSSLTTAMLSDHEIKRINTLKKLQAIDAERRKKNLIRQNKVLLEQAKQKAADEAESKKRKRMVTSKRFIQDELKRVKKARFSTDDGGSSGGGG